MKITHKPVIKFNEVTIWKLKICPKLNQKCIFISSGYKTYLPMIFILRIKMSLVFKLIKWKLEKCFQSFTLGIYCHENAHSSQVPQCDFDRAANISQRARDWIINVRDRLVPGNDRKEFIVIAIVTREEVFAVGFPPFWLHYFGVGRLIRHLC